MKIAVIILNFKRYQDSHNCLKAVYRSDVPNNSVIYLADNSNDSKQQTKLIKFFPEIKLIKNNKNFGFAAGNNIAINQALRNKATHILILNPDVSLPRIFFKPLLINLKNSKIGLIAPALKHKVKNKTYYGLDGHLNWLVAKPQHNGTHKITQKNLISAEFLTFACVLIKASVFKKTGLLDERYFMYFEDIDFCLRAKKKDFNSFLNPRIIASHQTSASFSNPLAKQKIIFISHLKFINKWLPFPQNIIAFAYQSFLYPYLYLLWSYQHWKYSSH